MPPRYTTYDGPYLAYEPLFRQANANQAWASGMAGTLAASVSISGSAPVPVPPDPQPSEEVDPLETLFEVFVVSKARKIVLHEFAVAKDEAGAQFRAGVDGALRTASLEPDDVTILCKAVGQVEVEKKPQRMKIVGDEATPTA